MITEIFNPQAGLTFTDILIIGIGILLGIIGWFLRGFSQVVKDLKISVDTLMRTVAVEQERINNVKDTIGDFTSQLGTKVSNISTQVDKHERDIAVLKTLENEYHNTSL